MSSPTDWITGAEIRERTGWNAQQLRRRIAAGKFPAKVDVDRWIRADVEARLLGKRAISADDGGPWVVNEEAIRLALEGLKRRGKETTVRERGSSSPGLEFAVGERRGARGAGAGGGNRTRTKSLGSFQATTTSRPRCLCS